MRAYKFNTAMSTLMIFINHVEKEGLTKATYDTFLKLLAPCAPHLTEELWSERGYTTSIHTERWPEYIEELALDALVTIGVQINGKMRGVIVLSPEATEAEALRTAQGEESLRARLTTPIRKIIYVKGKILNLILEE